MGKGYPHLCATTRVNLMHALRIKCKMMLSFSLKVCGDCRQYFKEQLIAQTTGPEVIEEQKKRLAEQHAMCIKDNDIWNAEVAKLREKRLAQEAVERDEYILKKIMNHDQQRELMLEQLESHVLLEKVTATVTEK